MGLDGLSYTAVTPRASLKSDANNKIYASVEHNVGEKHVLHVNILSHPMTVNESV